MSNVAVAIDLGGTNLRLAMVTDEGKIIDRWEEPTTQPRKVDAIFDQIRKGFVDLKSRNSNLKQFAGVGMGLPGFYDPRTDTLLGSPHFPEWKGMHVGQRLHETIDLPISVGNDANCAALGEKWMSPFSKFDDIVFITLGTGIGGGIISNGQLITGSHGAGAELGHVIVDPYGPVVGEGVPGSVESMTSGAAFQFHYGKSQAEMAEEARQGKKEAIEAFKKMGTYLARALATYAVVLDPEAFLLGGKGSLAFGLFEKTLRKEYAHRLKNHPALHTPIEIAHCGDDAGLLGAAYLVFVNRQQ